MTEEKKTRLETDLEFIANEDDWPRWPALPLKRPDQVGILIAGSGPKVFVIGLFEATPAGIRAAETIQYQDYEGMFDDGWRID
jgi:hypothetical protein